MRQAHGKLPLVAWILVAAVVFAVSPAFAEPINQDNYPGASGNTLGNAVGEVAVSTFERIAALPINGLAYGLVNLPSFYSIDQLVFGREGTFSEEEWRQVIRPWWLWALGIGLSPVLVAFVVLAGGFSIVRGVFLQNPRAAASAQETFLNLIVATLLVVTGPLILNFFLQVNDVIVELVKYRLVNIGAEISGLSKAGLLTEVNSGRPLLDALIRLAFAGMMFYINMMYLVRRFILAVLLIVMPFVAWSWAFKNTRTPMLVLLSELVTNSLMSASHAIVLGFYLSLAKANPAGMFSTWWAKLFALTMVVPTAALLRRILAGWLNLLGANEERWAGLATLGFGGIAGLATLAGGVMGSTANLVRTAAGTGRTAAGSPGAGIPGSAGGGSVLPGGIIGSTTVAGQSFFSRPVQVPPGTVGGPPGTAAIGMSPGGAVSTGSWMGGGGLTTVSMGDSPVFPGTPSYGADASPAGHPGYSLPAHPVGYKEDFRAGIFVPGDLAVKREDEAVAQAAAAQREAERQVARKEKTAMVLDAATEAAGAFGCFAGGVMSIGIGGPAGSAYSTLMEGAMRVPFAAARRIVAPSNSGLAGRASAGRSYSLDRPRWQ